MIIYSKNSGVNDAVIGRLETPIKMLIEHESDLMKKKGGICDWLFNVETSSHFGETIVTQRDFDIFYASAEGDGATSDTVCVTGSKFIENLQFMKEFTITAEMMEDANFGVAADAKRRIQNFVRSYYNTINRFCSAALIRGHKTYALFAGTSIDTTTADGYSLFNKAHVWGDVENDDYGTQCNYFSGDIAKKDGVYSIEKVESTIYTLANVIRNMLDERGETMGYVADTIILPGNKPTLEHLVKKICGSEGIVASANNDVNIHYGNWNVIVMPTWAPENDEIMVMSSEANKVLAGNMFFNRVPLTVANWIDYHTGNYNWTGRCRFGVGFGSYKHIVKAVEQTGDTLVENTEALPV